MLPEKFLHFVWRYGLFNHVSLQTTQKESVNIVFPGIHNFNQGPDFKEAKIKFEENVFAGHIELHMRNNEWYEHGHHLDPQYNNCILHVVFENTLEQFVLGYNNTIIPILCLESLIHEDIIQRYMAVQENKMQLPCQQIFKLPNNIDLERFKNRLIAERFSRKCQQIETELLGNNNDWELTFYHSLASSFGLKINKEIFYNLSLSIPLQLLHKYKNDAFKLEALFYGQANLLGAKDERAMVLNIEYHYLAKLHHLTPIKNAPLFLRLRPVSFPTIRLAQFITLIIQSKHLFSKLMLSFEAKDVKPYFDLEISDYWKEHYDFGKKFKKKISGKMGQSTIDAITINTIVPFVYLYDQLHHPDSERFSTFLEQIKPEHNSKISILTETLGLNNTTAYDSQSLLEWYDNYCIEKRCLDCIIGYHTLSN